MPFESFSTAVEEGGGGVAAVVFLLTFLLAVFFLTGLFAGLADLLSAFPVLSVFSAFSAFLTFSGGAGRDATALVSLCLTGRAASVFSVGLATDRVASGVPGPSAFDSTGFEAGGFT